MADKASATATGCTWPGTDPLYMAYHDTDWGVPEYDDRALFEKLVLVDHNFAKAGKFS